MRQSPLGFEFSRQSSSPYSRASSPRDVSATGFLCQVLQPDLARFSESYPSINRRHIDEILRSAQRIEAFWSYVTRMPSDGENDPYLSHMVQEVGERIRNLERELEALRDLQQRKRQTMLRDICKRRAAAVGPAGPDSILRTAAAVVGSEQAAGEKPEVPAAKARVATDIRRSLAFMDTSEAHNERSEPASPRLLELDPRRLMDVEKFDPSDFVKEVASDATAAVRARVEAQRASWQAKFEDEKRQLSTKIREVCESDQDEQREHEALVTRLMAKFEASGKPVPSGPPSSALRGSVRGGNRGSLFPANLRNSVLASSRSSTSRRPSTLGGSREGSPAHGRHSPGSGRSSKASKGAMRPQQKLSAQKTELDKELDNLREILGEPLSEDKQVRQWGAMLVGQLGLNSYPTKPKRWDWCAARTHQLCTPRVATSIQEAFGPSLEFSPGGSLDGGFGFSSLSRYMLGSPQQVHESLSDDLRPSTHGSARTRPSTHASTVGRAANSSFYEPGDKLV